LKNLLLEEIFNDNVQREISSTFVHDKLVCLFFYLFSKLIVFFPASLCSDPPLAITSGRREIVHGNGTSHESIISFACDQNYQLIGSSRILCANGSTFITAVILNAFQLVYLYMLCHIACDNIIICLQCFLIKFPHYHRLPEKPVFILKTCVRHHIVSESVH
jgi:hypothetical protein